MIPQKKSFKKQKKYENLKVEGFFTSLNLEGFSGVFSFYKYLQFVAAVVVVGFQWRRFLTINQWNFHLKTDKHIRGMKNRIENEKNPDESLSVSLYLLRNSSYFVSECLRGKREGESLKMALSGREWRLKTVRFSGKSSIWTGVISFWATFWAASISNFSKISWATRPCSSMRLETFFFFFFFFKLKFIIV